MTSKETSNMDESAQTSLVDNGSGRRNIVLTPVEQAMTWERMSGQRLPECERRRLLEGGEFAPPTSSMALAVNGVELARERLQLADEASSAARRERRLAAVELAAAYKRVAALAMDASA
jgi:hypothetical protein